MLDKDTIRQLKFTMKYNLKLDDNDRTLDDLDYWIQQDTLMIDEREYESLSKFMFVIDRNPLSKPYRVKLYFIPTMKERILGIHQIYGNTTKVKLIGEKEVLQEVNRVKRRELIDRSIYKELKRLREHEYEHMRNNRTYAETTLKQLYEYTTELDYVIMDTNIRNIQKRLESLEIYKNRIIEILKEKEENMTTTQKIRGRTVEVKDSAEVLMKYTSYYADKYRLGYKSLWYAYYYTKLKDVRKEIKTLEKMYEGLIE